MSFAACHVGVHMSTYYNECNLFKSIILTASDRADAASPTAVPASVTEDEMARRQRNWVVRVSLLSILAEGIILVDGTM